MEYTVDSDMTGESIANVKTYIEQYPDQTQRVLDAELAGQNRSTLVSWLESELAGPAEATPTEGEAVEDRTMMDDYEDAYAVSEQLVNAHAFERDRTMDMQLAGKPMYGGEHP